MKLLFIGDIIGRTGRQSVIDHLPGLRKSLKLDFVCVNGENAAGGFGLTKKIAEELFAVGVDCISGGNHTFAQREVMSFLDAEPRALRPITYPDGTPGRGVGEYTDERGRKVVVINVMGQVFMEPMDAPFAAVEKALSKFRMGANGNAKAIIVDMHAEATSEKMGMGHFCDGRASLVVGSHTHVPTADRQILPGGTAYQTDAGMCGDYDSVIGMDKAEPLRRFTKKLSSKRFEPATGEATMCGIYVETDDQTGMATRTEAVRIGGRLSQAVPVL